MRFATAFRVKLALDELMVARGLSTLDSEQSLDGVPSGSARLRGETSETKYGRARRGKRSRQRIASR